MELVAAGAKGRVLVRPKDVMGKSNLDCNERQIRMLLEKEVSKASITKLVGVWSTAQSHFARTRKLDPKVQKGRK